MVTSLKICEKVYGYKHTCGVIPESKLGALLYQEVNLVLDVHRNRTAYQGRGEGGKGYGDGGRGRLYTYRYSVTRMTLALRWAVVRAILMFR